MLITKELQRAMDTNRERDHLYKDGWRIQAAILQQLYPQGVPSTPQDMERATFIFMIVAKLVRCVVMPGHVDSLHDLGVYAFMLEHLEAAYDLSARSDKT